MIAESRKTGLWGEIYASRYLRGKGYNILTANYRTKTGEIDLIAEKDGTICFVEVKARKEGAYFDPAEAVDAGKEQNVRSTAAAYISLIGHKGPVRYDIIEVVCMDNKYGIRHTENAF